MPKKNLLFPSTQWIKSMDFWKANHWEMRWPIQLQKSHLIFTKSFSLDPISIHFFSIFTTFYLHFSFTFQIRIKIRMHEIFYIYGFRLDLTSLWYDLFSSHVKSRHNLCRKTSSQKNIKSKNALTCPSLNALHEFIIQTYVQDL